MALSRTALKKFIASSGRTVSITNTRECLRLGFTFWNSTITSGGSEDSGKKIAALWGNGDYGRLGFGNLESQWRPKYLNSSAFDNQSLREIACGGAHTLFLTESGNVYATGLNDYGQLGISEDKSYTTEPVPVSGILKEVIKISAGYHHSSALTVDGELYMWGKNSNGQLGLGKKAANVVKHPTKLECLNGVTIRLTSLGFEHSVAVTEKTRSAEKSFFKDLIPEIHGEDKGEALSWGGGASGRLGHGHESGILGFVKSNSEYTPRLIKTLEGLKVKIIAAGMLHSACIDENGFAYIFGERSKEKLVFEDGSKASVPSVMHKLPPSEEVACGGYHTCLVTRGGELYTCGSNENGCLGVGSTDIISSPERVEGPFLRYPVSKVSCGWKHTAAICGGHVYTWGWGGSHGTFSEGGLSSGGQLGHGDDVDYIEPRVVEFHSNLKPLQISCGFNHTGAILEYI